MRTLSPKALLAALNPSPVRADDFAVPKRRGQMTLHFNEDTALP
jgi:hypothetical protein